MRLAPDALDGALHAALERTNRPALVIDGRDSSSSHQPLSGLDESTTWLTTPDGASEVAAGERFATVVLVVDDVVGLRQAVTVLAGYGGAQAIGRARFIAVVVADAAAPLLLRHHPAAARLVDVDARLVGSAAVTNLVAGNRIDVVPVLVSLARAAALRVVTGPGGVWLGGDVAPPADPVFTRGYDAEADCPPTVVTGAPPTEPYAASAVIGRAPLVVSDAGEPLDEAVYNPHGFRRDWTRGMVSLDAATALTPRLIADVRDAQGVLVDAGAVVLRAGLAMAGVPLVAIEDPVERERHSVRARRAALLEHATFAWRSRLGVAAGVRHDLLPGDVRVSTEQADDVTDLLLARRYSGADLVVLPHDADGPTECFVPAPPSGAVAHVADRTPAEIVAAGGLIYVTRPAGLR